MLRIFSLISETIRNHARGGGPPPRRLLLTAVTQDMSELQKTQVKKWSKITPD